MPETIIRLIGPAKQVFFLFARFVAEHGKDTKVSEIKKESRK